MYIYQVYEEDEYGRIVCEFGYFSTRGKANHCRRKQWETVTDVYAIKHIKVNTHVKRIKLDCK